MLSGVAMNVSLTPHLEEMIRQQVDSGQYATASEVVREALRDFEHRVKARAMLEAALAEGFASLDRGEGVELTDELWDELMAEGDARAERGDPIDPLISGEF